MTIPDLYGQITEKDVPSAEPGLLRVLNRLQSSLQAGLAGDVTLARNVKCDIVTGVFSHGVPTGIKLTKVKVPGSVQVLGADGHFPLSATVQAGGSGGASAVILFADPTAKNVQATLLVTPEGTKTRSTANPNPTQGGSGGTGAASAGAVTITAGGNFFVDMAFTTFSFTPLSATKNTLILWTFTGYASGAPGVFQSRVARAGVGIGSTYNFFYNTMLQHQSWTFQLLAGNLGPVGVPIQLSVQVASPTGSPAAFNQDANDSCSVVAQELG